MVLDKELKGTREVLNEGKQQEWNLTNDEVMEALLTGIKEAYQKDIASTPLANYLRRHSHA